MANVDELRQQIAAAETRVARLKYEMSKQKKSEDTRRKILLGSFVIAATSSGSNPSRLRFFKMNGHELGDYLTKAEDRRLFGLTSEVQSDTSDGVMP